MKVIKIPYSLGALSNSSGLEKGPNSVLEKAREIWMNKSNENFEVSEISHNSDVERDLAKIEEEIRPLLDSRTFILGGDHSVTYAGFKAALRKYGESGLLVFDAHPDCFQNFKFPVHEDWLKFLVDEGKLNPRNVIIIGIRNYNVKELEFLTDNKIRYFNMKTISNNIDDNCDILMEICRNFRNLYVSIDIDVVDPAFAPGTGYLEPGGLSSREIIYYAQRIALLKNIRVVDLVEINPARDFNGMTSKLGARIMCEFIC